MSTPRLTEDDVGKTIVTSDGTELGRITEVRDGRPYIDADPDAFENVKTKLDWGEPEEDTYPLERAVVAEVTDDEVHLQ